MMGGSALRVEKKKIRRREEANSLSLSLSLVFEAIAEDEAAEDENKTNKRL